MELHRGYIALVARVIALQPTLDDANDALRAIISKTKEKRYHSGTVNKNLLCACAQIAEQALESTQGMKGVK